MSNNFYTTKTATLKATAADIRNFNAQQIKLRGEPIPAKVLDERGEYKTDQDLWGTSVTTDENGKVRISHKCVTNPKMGRNIAWNTDITSIRNNEAYIGWDKYCNIQTDMIKNGKYMFRNCTKLTSFDSDLSNLDFGYYMFTGAGITKFTSDLSSLSHAGNMFSNSNISSFKCTLHNLTDAAQMFWNTPLTSFSGDLSSLVNGYGMFYGTLLSKFYQKLSSLTDARYMFSYCTELVDFESDLGNLTNGRSMFDKAVNLAEFKGNLSNLIDGHSMFSNTSISSFDSNLSHLVNGVLMFSKCKNITSFNIDLNNLVEGGMMFSNSGLEVFVSNLSNLSDGAKMFAYSKLTTFVGDLSSLVDGLGMFIKCKLNPQSVMHIADSLPTVSSGNIALGIDVVNNSSTLEQQLQTFAKNATFNSWEELKQMFIDKGWTVTFQYGGTYTDITLSEDEEFRGTPIYARLIEVTPKGEEYTEEEKAKAEYCTEDGTKYYNIDWGHDVTDYDQYQYFGSLLEACGYYGVIPKKYLEEV